MILGMILLAQISFNQVGRLGSIGFTFRTASAMEASLDVTALGDDTWRLATEFSCVPRHACEPVKRRYIVHNPTDEPVRVVNGVPTEPDGAIVLRLRDHPWVLADAS